MTDLVINGPLCASAVTIGSDSRTLLRFNLRDGTLEFGSHLNPDEAGRQAIEAMRAAYAGWFREAIAAEREACAQIAESSAPLVAAAIRARR